MIMPSLPQNDPNQEKRQEWLNRKRQDYAYSPTPSLPPLPQIEELPRYESFSLKYQIKKDEATFKLVLNMIDVIARNAFDSLDKLEEYADYFPVLTDPSSVKTFRYDIEFARQRIAGANPMVIERVEDKLPDKFPVTDAIFQSIVGSDKTLDSEAKQGRLYLTDYALLDGLAPGKYENGMKFFAAPIVLYYWQSSGFRDRGTLTPIAIQLNQKPGANSPIFTPLDGMQWLVAKTFAQIADGNHHEMVSHLGHTHLAIDPFPIATARHLGENHPLGILLRPHFEFTLAINELGRQQLLSLGGYGERLLAVALEEVSMLVSKSVETWNFTEFSLPQELKRRKVDEPTLLPDYPYRDDGLLVWNAIREFAVNYLSLYYSSAADIVNDLELRDWLQELRAADGGRVNGLPEKIENLEQLTQIVTQIIFTAGPQHAAVNYPQWDFMGFIPNMPLAGYAPYPTNKEAIIREADLMKILPPHKQTTTQEQLMYSLSAVRHNRLGYYQKNTFDDPRALQVVEKFQHQLNDVEVQIDSRNSRRREPYKFLKPSLIPNSLNI